jgi:hypothetical protein
MRVLEKKSLKLMGLLKKKMDGAFAFAYLYLYPTLPPGPDLGIDNGMTCVDAPACMLLLPVGAKTIYARKCAGSKPPSSLSRIVAKHLLTSLLIPQMSSFDSTMTFSRP